MKYFNYFNSIITKNSLLYAKNAVSSLLTILCICYKNYVVVFDDFTLEVVSKMTSVVKYSPGTNAKLYEVEVMTAEQVNSACEKANVAFDTWKKTSLLERKQLLDNLIEVIQQNKEHIIDTIIRDVDKPFCEAETEIIEGCDIISYYCQEFFEGIDDLKEIELDKQMWPQKKAYILYQPIGVYAVIKPWNYPFELNLWAIVPILLAGNTIVFKPSELSTATGILLSKLINEAGFPDGVFNIITGDGSTGKSLVNNSLVKGISFTGSSKVGKEISQNRKDIEKKLSLEMGGSDFAIVLEDENDDVTIPGILWGCFTNAGQVCVSTEKILIASEVYSLFVEKLLCEAKKLKMRSEIPPIISKKQFLHAKSILEDAVLHGCTVLCGGICDELTNEISPTIIECPDYDYLVNIGELFAPIVFIAPYFNEKRMIDVINRSNYGLGCSIWTGDYKAHSYLFKELDVGMIWVNEVNLPMPQVPWIGKKDSGIGFNLSKRAVYDSMEEKVIHIDFDNEKRFWWFPYEK